MRRVVVAPDKFKGSLSAAAAAAAIERGLRAAQPELAVQLVPMADGGEGTVEAFLGTGDWQRITRSVRGPLGAAVRADFAFDGSRAVIEMAAASGLALLTPERYDPLRATSYGTGELVRAALDCGARRIVVAIGGSATNDAGAGMLCALGARLLDDDAGELAPGGAALAQLARIDLAQLDERLRDVAIDIAADVDHPLLGPRGASAVFGPQKGASDRDVRTLDAALGRFADVTAQTLGLDVRAEPGMGAAGGLGFALRAYFNATLGPGVALVAALHDLSRLLAGATMCFTGEGSIDEQTLGGKTVDGVASLARAANVAVIAFGGRVAARAERLLAQRGVLVFPIADGPLELDEALARAPELLERAAARVGHLVLP